MLFLIKFSGIPILLVKIAELDKLKSMKESFWAFMMGTQPRLGEDSPVMSLSGVTPAIKMIHDYSDNQTELRQKMEQIDDQIHKLLWVCRLRSILLEIAGIERQPLWALGKQVISCYDVQISELRSLKLRKDLVSDSRI